MGELKSINWNAVSELGLMERINREILHPLGLAMTRNPETGFSEGVLISDDGKFEYHSEMPSKVLSDDEVRKLIIAGGV